MGIIPVVAVELQVLGIEYRDANALVLDRRTDRCVEGLLAAILRAAYRLDEGVPVAARAARDDLVLDPVGNEKDHLLRGIAGLIAAEAGTRHGGAEVCQRAFDVGAKVGVAVRCRNAVLVVDREK